MTPQQQKPRNWPRMAIGPKGQQARFDCMGDIPHGWKLLIPLPGTEPEPEPVKRGPGRPKKDADE